MHVLRLPITLTMFNGKKVDEKITHAAVISLRLGEHRERLIALVYNNIKWPLILGMPWLEKHYSIINFGTKQLIFTTPCVHQGHCPQDTIVPYHQPQATALPKPERLLKPPTPESSPTDFKNPVQIRAAAFILAARQKGSEVFSYSLRYLDRALDTGSVNDLREQQTTFRCGNAAIVVDKNTDPREILPQRYHEFLDVFSRAKANTLPPHRDDDHSIDLLPGRQPPYSKIYPMSREKLETLRDHLTKELDKGFIRISKSPAAAPVIFVKKANGDLRFCVDYRGLNDATIKNRYPLPLISETLDRLSKARFYTKLDIISAFSKLRIKEGDEWKTAFLTRYGLFEYTVLPFGLCNGPASFQSYINKALQGLLDEICTAYMDDILIYSRTKDEHRKHVAEILLRLRQFGLQVDITKCEFEVTSVKYLGLIITANGIQMDPAKVAAIQDWPSPQSAKDIQIFLGFANFYRRFIPKYSKLARALTELTKKDAKFSWSSECESSFFRIKLEFNEGRILAHFDPDRLTVLETDSSNWANAAVLSQYDDYKILRPVAFMSRKLLPAECNYEIYDKELLAIVKAFDHFSAELQSLQDPVQVVTDHKNLEWFTTTKKLSQRQARRSEFLSQFRFKIDYRPGRKGGKPDALTRISTDRPQTEDDPRHQHQYQQLIKPSMILRPVQTDTEDDPLSAERWRTANQEDLTVRRIRKRLQDDETTDDELQLPDCKLTEFGFTYNGRQFVPADLRLAMMKHFHENPLYGHRGANGLFSLIYREYWWQEMHKDTGKYTRGCQSCGRNNPSTQRPYGLLHPLAAPERSFRHLTMDFIGPFTPAKTNEKMRYILHVVCRLTKRTWAIATQSMDATETANSFLHYVFRMTGLPDSITSDQGSSFISQVWQNLCKRLDIKHNLSTAYHPQTDGQTERANKTLEVYLRHYVNYHQDDWPEWLPLAEFSINNHPSATTGVSPFFATYGHHPRMAFEPQTSFEGTRIISQFADDMNDVQLKCRESIDRAQAFQSSYANEKRLPAPLFQAGDRVFLDVRNLARERPTAKLDHIRAGPYSILRMKTPLVAKIDLPPTARIKNDFHVSLLRPYSKDAYPEQQQTEPPPLYVDNDAIPVYETEEIISSRYRWRRLEYLVKWTGYEHPTWQPHWDLTDTQELIDNYHTTHPQAPGPALTI